MEKTTVEANTARIDANGRVLLPAAVRKLLQLSPGDEAILVLDDDSVTLLSAAAAIKRVQASVRQYVPANVSLSEELIRERRAEFAGELNEE